MPLKPSTEPIDITASDAIFKKIEKQIKVDDSPTAYRKKWPYYRENYGMAAKNILDAIHKEHRSQRIRAVGISVSTLKQQYYQGVYWLLDNLDKGGEYLKYYQHSRCLSFQNEGYIEIHYKGVVQSEAVSSIDWRLEFMKYLEEATEIGTKFHKVSIEVTPDDKDYLRAQLEPFGDIYLFKVTDNEVLVIKDK